MANPQLEDGYLKISNELYDSLVKTRFPGESRQVLDFIIRKTYGFNKKEDQISLSQFQEATGLKRSSVVRGIRKLIEMNIINKDNNGFITKYSLQKDHSKWGSLKKVTSYQKATKTSSEKATTLVTKKLPKLVTKKLHTKDNKDNITKDNKYSSDRKDNSSNNETIDKYTQFHRWLHDLENDNFINDIVKELWDYWGFRPQKFKEEEIKKMRIWIKSNPSKAPKSQWKRFVGGWLRRSFEQQKPTDLQTPLKSDAEYQHYENKKRMESPKKDESWYWFRLTDEQRSIYLSTPKDKRPTTQEYYFTIHPDKRDEDE